MLLGVRIQNFDVFDDDSMGVMIDDRSQNKHRLMNLNALIGRNKTGKTSYLHAMSFIKKCVTTNVAAASTGDGRPGFSKLVEKKDKPAVFSMFFKLKHTQTQKPVYLQYDLSVSATTYGSPYVSEEIVTLSEKKENGEFEETQIMHFVDSDGYIMSASSANGEREQTQISDEHICALSIYGKITLYPLFCMLYREISTWFFCRFSTDMTSTYFAEGNAPGGHKHLNGTGSNVGNVLEYMKKSNPEQYDRIMDEINESLPTMKKKKKKNLPITLEDSPDKLLLYLLMLHDADPHSTIFIETPDKDLYHDMVDVLADEMREFSINHPYSQIVFTTHNPYIVESMSPKEVWIFKRTYESEFGDVEITSAALDPIVDSMFKEGVGMGAIWYSGHLDDDIFSEE